MNHQHNPSNDKETPAKVQHSIEKYVGRTDKLTKERQRQLVGKIDRRNGDARLADK